MNTCRLTGPGSPVDRIRRCAGTVSGVVWRWAGAAAVGAVVVSIAACGGGGGSSGGADGPAVVVEPTRTVVLSVEASATTASVGTPIRLTARARTQNTSVTGYAWTFSDGQTASGPEVTVSFRTPGAITARVAATSAEGQRTEADAAVFVFGGSDPTPASLNLPDVYGDVTGNGRLELDDALLLAQGLSRARELTAAQQRAGDLDVDADISAEDLALLLQAVLDNRSLPSAALKREIYPGAVLPIVSPALLGADDRIEVRVAGQATLAPVRVALGYATLIVPTQVTRYGSDVPLEVVVNGRVADTIALTIKAPPTLPADARADVLAFLGEWRSAVQAHVRETDRMVAAAALGSADAAVFRSGGSAALALLDKAQADLVRVLDGPGGADLARIIQRSLYANGLSDLRASLPVSHRDGGTASARVGTLAALTPDQVCDLLIPGVCGAKTWADRLGTFSKVQAGACTLVAGAALIGGVAIPFDGPALDLTAIAGFAKVCLPLSAVMSVAEFFTAALDAVDFKLTSSITPASLGAGQTATLSASVELLNFAQFCGPAANALVGEALRRSLGNRLVARVMRDNALVDQLAKVFARTSNDVYEEFLKEIRNAVGTALDSTGALAVVEKVAVLACPNLRAGSLAVPASRVFTALPADRGSLTFNADGTGTYRCPAVVATPSITLSGQLKLCDADVATTRQTVTCGGSRDVTITMGDNGSALDDIYEVVINGSTVLTSSSPVRSVSKVVTLPIGRTTVLMRGLAAPDGIGTYFISFSGARLVSGDALTGSDLTPGRTKQFVIEVQ